MDNTEIEKLEKKVEFFKEHVNSGKSADELEKEFETWYEEEYRKTQYENYIKRVTEEVQEESEISLKFFKESYDQICYCETGNLRISRVCTLRAFINKMVLRRLNRDVGTIKIVFCLDSGNWDCVINCRGEMSKSSCFEKYENMLISTSGKYYSQIGGHEEFKIYPLCDKVNLKDW